MASDFGPSDQPASSRIPGAICIKETSSDHDRHPDRFTTLPDEQALQATVTALEEHGFSVEIVGDLDAARQAVLARIPGGSSRRDAAAQAPGTRTARWRRGVR